VFTARLEIGLQMKQITFILKGLKKRMYLNKHETTVLGIICPSVLSKKEK